MKAFWALVGFLMLGASAYLFLAPREGGREGGQEGGIAGVEPAPILPAPEPVGAAPPRENQQRAHESLAEAPVPAEPAPERPRPPEPADDGPAGASAPDSPAEPEAPIDEPAPAEAREAGPKTTRKADGTRVVEDRFVLRGEGTLKDPFKVTWDHLLSAQDDYVPRDGRKKIPDRISMLDGKYVEITGYVAFPLFAEAADECLVMMNQWDGCCIGVPPTPYDAVEVRLNTPATGNARLTTYGTLTGKLRIEPHLVGGWLVGLYVMDGAILKPESYGGFAP